MYAVIFGSSPAVEFYFLRNKTNESSENQWIYSLDLRFFQDGVNFANNKCVPVLLKLPTSRDKRWGRILKRKSKEAL